jgi:CHAT domain-containing protein
MNLIRPVFVVCLTIAPALAMLEPTIAQATIAQVLERDAPTLAQQAKTLYETGQFAAAVAIWQQLADQFKAQGNDVGQAIALSNLSLTWQQTGQLTEAEGAIATSLELLRTAPSNPATQAALAQALNTQGSLQLAQGKAEVALSTWQQAEQTYAQVNDRAGVQRSQLNQAQALQTLGFYRRALKLLQTVQATQTKPDPALQVATLQGLGNVLRLVGDLDGSRAALEQGLAIAQPQQLTAAIADLHLSLANTQRDQQDFPAAQASYQQAMQARSSVTRLRALLNLFSLLVEQQSTTALSLLPTIQAELARRSGDRLTTEAQINLAQSLGKLATQTDDLKLQRATLLSTAAQQATQRGDQRSQSYALGALGRLYEQNRRFTEAEILTQQALQLAQTANAADIAYQWQWQLGRLRSAQTDRAGAIVAYQEAVNLLQSLRSDLVAVNSDVQFSFRESVEPIYRELVSLLLAATPDQTQLIQARSLIESLQLAELDNFFREACLQAQAEQIDQVDRQVAVIYPIILEDRLEVIFSLPDRPLQRHTVRRSQSELEATLAQLKQSFGRLAPTQERLRLAQQVYQWLIQPISADLSQSEIKTLVFVLDGALRDIPMAALHDGKQYLVEQYSVALSPGLQLLPSRPVDKQQLQGLKGGLSEARQGFSALPAVQLELSQITSEIRGEVLLNEELTIANLQTQLSNASYPIVHLATHGQFGSSAKDTFILTWDGRINVKQLDSLFRRRQETTTSPLELLVLSACQTATGDNRAILGLAGIAVRSGARSTLAALWSVKDQATAEFMTQFYRSLVQPDVTRAEAVRRAQLSLLRNPRYQHPVFWSPFVLVGSWQ